MYSWHQVLNCGKGRKLLPRTLYTHKNWLPQCTLDTILSSTQPTTGRHQKMSARREKYERGQFPPELEYTVSGQATCNTCKEKIGEGRIRGGFNMTPWYHLKCFRFFTATPVAEDLTGYDKLTGDDQESVRNKVTIKNPKGGKVGAFTRRKSLRAGKKPSTSIDDEVATADHATRRRS
jgi:hypothetical protein